MGSFNESRLQLARRRRGLNKKQLAEQVGLSSRSIRAYEAGKTTPTEAHVGLLAETLNFPAAFFFRPDAPEPIAPSAPTFRKLTTLRAAERDQALAAAEFGLEVDRYIRAQFRLPEPAIPDLADLEPRMAAIALRAEWGLGARRVKNVVHLLESKGVRVFSLSEDTRRLDAFAIWCAQRPYVFLNTQKTAEHARMDAAHELGHLVLHQQVGNRERRIEHEADEFAREFLVPTDDLLAHAPAFPTAVALRQLKRRWGVSAWDLAVCLSKAGLLRPEHRYRTLMIDLQQRGWRTEEPDGLPRERSQVLDKVLRALRTDGVSLQSIAHHLKIPKADLAGLFFGLTMVDLAGGGQTSTRSRPDLRVVR